MTMTAADSSPADSPEASSVTSSSQQPQQMDQNHDKDDKNAATDANDNISSTTTTTDSNISGTLLKNDATNNIISSASTEANITIKPRKRRRRNNGTNNTNNRRHSRRKTRVIEVLGEASANEGDAGENYQNNDKEKKKEGKSQQSKETTASDNANNNKNAKSATEGDEDVSNNTNTTIFPTRKRKHHLISNGIEIGSSLQNSKNANRRNRLFSQHFSSSAAASSSNASSSGSQQGNGSSSSAPGLKYSRDYQQPEQQKSLLEEYYEAKSAEEGILKDLRAASSSSSSTSIEVEQQLALERKLLEIVSKKMPLTALSQRREGAVLSGCVSMAWKPPPYVTKMTSETVSKIREENRIDVQGDKVPNPIQDFVSMRLPQSILTVLKEKNIVLPTSIQMQALPVLLSGRDLLGVAFTGSGKTLTFSVPMILHALAEEHKMPLKPQEGPIGLIMCPSRELAKQTGDVVERICEQFYKDGYPRLRTMFCIGGRSMRECDELIAQGVHMVIATPGRLKHMLNVKKFNLDMCKYFCLDEADRLVDMGFEQEIREIFDYLTAVERQTVLFSATMPAKIRLFAESALTNHVIVNVGRAGSANMNIVQEVEYVKPQEKIRHLIESLKKSPPPALVFAANKDDVDEIHEYLLLKGVRAASIHGGKTQDEREEAIGEFVSGKKNVLVATDIASKGLDFKGIQHVINFDLPQEIEDYVHRIGRTGRGTARGLATSYINEEAPLHTLLDLRGLLIEAKQHVPRMLHELGEQVGIQTEIGDTKGCSYCGGLGHRITQCRKLERDRKEMMNQSMGEDALR